MAPRLSLDDLHVIAARPFEPDGFLVESWPCPICGEHRRLDEAWQLRVRNSRGPAYERDVLACADCASLVRPPAGER